MLWKVGNQFLNPDLIAHIDLNHEGGAGVRLVCAGQEFVFVGDDATALREHFAVEEVDGKPVAKAPAKPEIAVIEKAPPDPEVTPEVIPDTVETLYPDGPPKHPDVPPKATPIAPAPVPAPPPGAVVAPTPTPTPPPATPPAVVPPKPAGAIP